MKKNLKLIKEYKPNNYNIYLPLVGLLGSCLWFFIGLFSEQRFMIWLSWTISIISFLSFLWTSVIMSASKSCRPIIRIYPSKIGLIIDSKFGEELLKKSDIKSIFRVKIKRTNNVGILLKNPENFFRVQAQKISDLKLKRNLLNSFLHYLFFKNRKIPVTFKQLRSSDFKDLYYVSHQIIKINKSEYGFHIFFPEAFYSLKPLFAFINPEKVKADELLFDLETLIKKENRSNMAKF